MKGRRTPEEALADVARTLYVRLPHTIKNEKEIRQHLVGDTRIKLPRQSSRYCHVIFPNEAEKIKNMKKLRRVTINGKNIIARAPKINPTEKKIKKREKKLKIKIPKPKPEPKITRTVYVSNIKPGTKVQEIKDAFPGCVSLALLKSRNGKNGKALVKFGSLSLAGEYLRKERQPPEVRGICVQIAPDTRNKNKPKKKKKKENEESTSLKIYDGETETNAQKSEEQRDNSKDSDSENEDDKESDCDVDAL